ncbi:hypothetical protein [Microbispora sp. NPDC046933]|uniref:hypothetical protein n=1 Tax=Microbispora sp. NPDC046933 TaxID=3155618 RepID=UPI0033F640D3
MRVPESSRFLAEQVSGIGVSYGPGPGDLASRNGIAAVAERESVFATCRHPKAPHPTGR